jgi:hypothetical protein
MTFRDGLALPVLLAVAACSAPKTAAATQAERFSTLRFAADAGGETAPAIAGEANAYAIDLVFERSDGSRLVAPQLVVFAGQTGTIALVKPIAYPADVDADSVAPPAPALEEGIRLEACASRAGDGGVVLAFRARMTKVTGPAVEATTGGAEGREAVALPQVDAVEFSGARWLEPGVRGMIARVPGPDGSGPLLVLARATPQRVPPPPADGDFAVPGQPVAPAAAPDLSRPMTGHTKHLRVSAVRVSREFGPGVVIDETAAPDVLKSAGGEILRDFETYTCLDGRVRLAGTIGAASFSAVLDDGGRVSITWNGRTACVRANEGRRFVAVAPVEGGGTAGVIVSVNADD